jgi:uncharacterized protein YfbU (UPF0304 family)
MALTIKKRPTTLDDCLKLKKYYPFNFLRGVSKNVDLSLIFFSQAPTLAGVLRQAGLTESDCDTIIDTLNLHNELNAALLENGGKKKIVDIKFLVMAIAIHKAFYILYPGIKERCEREHAFAMKNGYMRCWHGPVRHLPELRYLKWNARGQLIGADKKLYSAMFSGLKNQAGNSAIQSLEVYHAAQIVHCIHHNTKINKMMSRVFNYCHDSVDLYTKKDEHDSVMSFVRKGLDAPHFPEYGIRCDMDGDVSDITGENRKKQYYKFGTEVKLEDTLDPKYKFENTIKE